MCAEFEREWGTLLRRGLLRAAVELARALGCYKVTTLRPATDEPVDPAADAATGHVDAAFDQVGLKPDLSDYHMLLYVPK